MRASRSLPTLTGRAPDRMLITAATVCWNHSLELELLNISALRELVLILTFLSFKSVAVETAAAAAVAAAVAPTALLLRIDQLFFAAVLLLLLLLD